MATTLHEIGECLMEMNKLSDAKEYLEKALEINQRTSNDLTTDERVATVLHDMVRCLMEINKYCDAKEYLEKALEINQQTSNDVATHEKWLLFCM